MESVSNSKYIVIDSGTLNHMDARKDSFSSLDSKICISIHMGYYSQILSKGKGTIHLEHSSFQNVLYVPSLDSNMLSVYQTKHTNFYNPKQNEKTMRSYEPSSSKKDKKRGKEKTMFSYFGIVFHLEISCIKNTID